MFLFVYSSLKYCTCRIWQTELLGAEFYKTSVQETWNFMQILLLKSYQGWSGTLLPLSESGVVFLLSRILLLSHSPEKIRIAPSSLSVPPASLTVTLSSSLVRSQMSSTDARQGLRNGQTWWRSWTVIKIIMRSTGVWYIILTIRHLLPLDAEIQRLEWAQPFSDNIIQNCRLVVNNVFSLDTLLLTLSEDTE